MKRSSLSELARTADFGVDHDSVRFRHDGRLHRAFREGCSAAVRQLLASPSLGRLFDAGLVRFEPVGLEIEGFDLVVAVEEVEPVSFATEWPTVMIGEAAKCIVRISAELAALGLALKDAHPWNVLFRSTEPVFVDLGSIVESSEVPLGWVRELRRHLLLPLALDAAHMHASSEAVLREHRPLGAKARWDNRWLWPMFPIQLVPMWARLRRRPEKFYKSLLDYLERLPSRGRKMDWTDYAQGAAEVGQRERYSGKQRAADEFLQALPPGVVVDVAANRGWYCELAVSHGNRVIAFDIDDRALCELYARAREIRAPILPLRIDFVWPPGSYGMGLAFSAAFDRIQGDTVMALAILHHLARNQSVRFEFFAQNIARLAHNAAIVEFIPRNDEHVARWPLAKEPWYEMDNLIAAMKAYFPKVDVVPSSPEPRQMLLFQR